MKVTKEMSIGDVLMMDMGVAEIFLNAGLHCLGCPASQMESIADAGMVHGIDVEELIEDLNAFFQEKYNI